MTERKCEWSIEDEIADHIEFRYCATGKPATFTTCEPIGGVVCEDHKCRCSKPIADEKILWCVECEIAWWGIKACPRCRKVP